MKALNPRLPCISPTRDPREQLFTPTPSFLLWHTSLVSLLLLSKKYYDYVTARCSAVQWFRASTLVRVGLAHSVPPLHFFSLSTPIRCALFLCVLSSLKVKTKTYYYLWTKLYSDTLGFGVELWALTVVSSLLPKMLSSTGHGQARSTWSADSQT